MRQKEAPRLYGGNGNGIAVAPVSQVQLPGDPEPPRRRRSAGHTVGWLLVIVVAGILFAALYLSKGSPGSPALVTTRALAAGDRITAGDLTVADVGVPGVATIPGSRLAAVVGERASGPLAAGSILSPSSLASGPELAAGQEGIALALNPDQAAQGILAVGQGVLVVGQLTTSGGLQPATPVSAPAQVLAISAGPANSGKVLVDLALTQADAAAVSAAMATPQGVRLVVLAGAANG